MYEYRNVKTGEIVVTSTRVSGANWEPVEQPEQEKQESGQTRPRRKKE